MAGDLDPSFIRKTLVLSTAHLTPTQRERMSSIADAIEYGWIMWAFDERGDDDIGDELWAICELARKHGCDWIKFDCDAGLVSGLPDFKW